MPRHSRGMTPSVLPTGYALDPAWHAERDRLDSLTSLYDPRTLALCERLGLAPGWNCLDAGAGTGSLAAALAARVGPAGTVTALDADARFLAPLESERLIVVGKPGSRVLHHDPRRRRGRAGRGAHGRRRRRERTSTPARPAASAPPTSVGNSAGRNARRRCADRPEGAAGSPGYRTEPAPARGSRSRVAGHNEGNDHGEADRALRPSRGPGCVRAPLRRY